MVDMEARGVPALMVASNEFVEAAVAQSKALGLSPAAIFVQHPIQDRTDKEIKEIAHRAMPAILQALTE